MPAATAFSVPKPKKSASPAAPGGKLVRPKRPSRPGDSSKRVSGDGTRRATIAAQHRAEIADFQMQFGEDFERALDRVMAEQDELDRMIGSIIARAEEGALA